MTEEAIMQLKLKHFKTSLSAFASSSDKFRILSFVPDVADSRAATPTPATLYVLDSSFNPPTVAHLRIASSALSYDRGAHPRRLLLLLATQNADKAPKPASFEQRLVLMSIFAADLRKEFARSAGLNESTPELDNTPVVDIGVTKCPYFHDKATAISASGVYPSKLTQVHLTGFDTLIRIMDPKYYPPRHDLGPLEPFLSQHRMRVTYRTDADWGNRAEQDYYLHKLGDGDLESIGGKKEWAQMIEMVEGKRDGEEVVSSTKVREAVKSNDKDMLLKLVTEGVADWVRKEKLYVQDV